MIRKQQPERRRWKRQWFNGSVRVFSDTVEIDGLGIAVSPGGMYLFAAAHLPIGAQVTLEFQPPHAREVINVTGTIRHRTVYLYGIAFDQSAASANSAGLAVHQS